MAAALVAAPPSSAATSGGGSASTKPGGTSGTTSPCALGNTFGRMFPSLKPATWDGTSVNNLAQWTMELSHLDSVNQLPGVEDDLAMNLEAGYTYTGQFIDHDITLDNTPRSLTDAIDISTLRNARTPQLDLDSVYGNGPTGSPLMYEADGMHLKLGRALLSLGTNDPDPHDLLRDTDLGTGTTGQAIIGDPRNDENKIVASLHELFLRFHNKVVDSLAAKNPTWDNATVFAKARQQVTWYYQWAVLTDFLPTIVGTRTAGQVVSRTRTGAWTTNLKFYNPCRVSTPIEFSGAAYRFGHSMVRDAYIVNGFTESVPIFSLDLSNPHNSLVGFQPTADDMAFDWRHFFSMDSGIPPQRAYKIDNSLVPQLRLLPGPAAGGESTILAQRNLLRGEQYLLPSGQDVAKAMGIEPLEDGKIIIGPALGVGAPTLSINQVSPAFKGKAPLWTYILAESVNQAFKVSKGKIVSAQTGPFTLGPVGGRIVAETLVGFLKADPNSVLNNPSFVPSTSFGSPDGTFRVKDIIRIATGEQSLG